MTKLSIEFASVICHSLGDKFMIHIFGDCLIIYSAKNYV
jgi:hypothetical protein